MAEVKVVVRNEVQGQNAIRQQAEQWNNLKSTLGKLSGAFGIVAAGMAATWKIAEQGAALELTATRFDKLSASIGTTSDALLNDLSAATGGMMTNAQMMESASQIISLGLADNQKDVVDLASLVSELGWDMQQVILTFANNSKMRLDALGLSVTDVEKRAADLEAQGYDTDRAFDLAVIQAGQAKLELLGSAAGTSAGEMKELKANVGELLDALKINISEGINPSIEAFNILFDVANNGGDIISGIVDANIEQAQSVDDLIAQYQRLDSQLGAGSTFTGTSDDIRANMEKVRLAILDASGSADEYTAALIEMGIASEWHVRVNKNAYASDFLRQKQLLEQTRAQEELTRAVEQADSVLMQHASAYQFVTGKGESLALTIAQVNYHQEEAYETTVSATDALEANKEAIIKAKTEHDKLRDAIIETTAAQDAMNRLRTQQFLNATTDSLIEYTTTAVWAGGRTEEQQANFEELSQSADRIRDNIRSLTGGTAGLGLTTEELNKKLEEQYAQLDRVEGALGPLAGIQREMVSSSSGWSVNLDLLNEQMGSYIVSAGASAEQTGIWMMATGELTKEQYLAAQNTILMQAEMEKLAQEYADGTISLGELKDGLDDIVANSPYVTQFDLEENDARNKLREIAGQLDALDGRHVRSTVEIVETGGGGGKGGGDKDGGTPPSGPPPPPASPPPGGNLPPGAASMGATGYAVPSGAGINISFAGAIFQGTSQQMANQIVQTVAEKIGRLA